MNWSAAARNLFGSSSHQGSTVGATMELDDKVCYCFRVSKRKLINFTRQTQPSRPSQLADCFGAGTGCGWCIPFLIRLHEEVMGQQEKTEPQLFEGSTEDYEQMRLNYQQQVKSGDHQKNQHGSGANIDGGESLEQDEEDL
ncbi:MAG: (2Fe-2S)-binding protein [Planctomycetota bacterium]